MNEQMTVTIPLERYEGLIKTECKVEAIVGQILRHKYISTEDLLYVIDTELSVELAEALKREYEKINNSEKSDVE